MRRGLCCSLPTAAAMAGALAAGTSARLLHVTAPRHGPSTSDASSSSSSTKREGGTSNDGDSGQSAPREQVRMQTLGDYLRNLPRGFRELLLYSPLLAYLCFVLYQQKTYFRDPGEPWYAVFGLWRARRVGGWLLESSEAPLPAVPDAAATPRVQQRVDLVDDRTSGATKNLSSVADRARASAPPIAPFSVLRSGSPADAASATTVWGRDVHALRALRRADTGAIYGYEPVEASWSSSTGAGGVWWQRLRRALA